MKRESYRRAFALCAVLILDASCNQDVPVPGGATDKGSAAQVVKTKVAKIVFVGKQDACDCTRGRVDDSFAALETALAGRGNIPVERIRVDIDEDKVAPYAQKRAIMVLPAIYLLDESGELVQVLQGEVTAAQLDALL